MPKILIILVFIRLANCAGCQQDGSESQPRRTSRFRRRGRLQSTRYESQLSRTEVALGTLIL